MGAVLALLSSALWGSSDFVGGILAKRFKAIAVTGISQAIGLCFAVLCLLLTNQWIAPTLDWDGYFLPGVVAGIAGFIGLVALYSGLATGRMGVVSPISSLSAIVPIIFALARGESPKLMQAVGMCVALVGAFCASGPELTSGISIRPLFFGCAAALGFGTALTFMEIGSRKSPFLTMTSMRCASVLVCLVLAIGYRSLGGVTRSTVDRRVLCGLLFVGLADFSANFFLGLATTHGLVSIAMVLGSLFPIVTALLAFRFLRERLLKVQYLGIALALLGVAIIASA